MQPSVIRWRVPDAALTEKIINSCDSLLISACLREGIDPESASAPETIKDASKRFFDISEGVLSNLSGSERAKLADYIGLVATGAKAKPSFAIFDRGLGQSPSQFPSTFMSLNASNKIRIPFVQGKFNMGSTGVLPFCGDRNLQLIISKKHPAIAGKIEDGDCWGLTVVRRVPPVGQMKSYVFKYLAPENKEVLRFKAESLKILPENGSYPHAYQGELEYGTFIKLYEYNIGPGLRANILLNLYNRLNLLLPRPSLPVRLYERRKEQGGHSYETTLAGLTTRLEVDRNENLEPNFPSSSNIVVDGVSLDLDIYAFKKRAKGSAKEQYAKSEGIVFSLNGQAHGFLNKDFFSRKKTGMDYLKNSLLVHVDCSRIDPVRHVDLFMNSRDRLRDDQLKNRIERKLEKVISKHEGLRELRERRKREMLADPMWR